MVIYLDLVFLLNFCYDFLLLMTISIVLKRFTKIYKILLGSLIGALSIFILFVPFFEGILLCLKILISLIMCLLTFGYKNIKYFFLNVIYLYMCSIILAGFLYMLDLEFSELHQGIVFYFKCLSVNYILLIIIAPIILYIYIWQSKKTKEHQNFYFKVKIVLKNNKEY